MPRRMAVTKVKDFQDPVHGFIRILPQEHAIVDTFPFQRLRRVSQLGLTSRLYHGAEHTRFGHSLGVMHLAGRATERILTENDVAIRGVAGWSEAEYGERCAGIVQLARLGGLLHDVGHSPFSHAGEQRLFAGKLRHEAYSAAIVQDTEIGVLVDEALKDHGMNRTDVVNLLSGENVPGAYGFVRQLLDSPYDVDKMDYLMRDSHYCGVAYGTFDMDRLITSLTLDTEHETGELRLAVEWGGYHALEALVIARYFMFTQVYFHRVRRAYDLILTDFVQDCLADAYGSATYPAPPQLDDYLKWDDSRVLSLAVDRMDASTENLAWMICTRRHPKLVFETVPHPDMMEARKALRQLLPEVSARFPETRLWRDKATDHPERYQGEDIPIKKRDVPDHFISFVGTSEALKGLREVGQVRLYAYIGDDTQRLDEIRQFCRALMS